LSTSFAGNLRRIAFIALGDMGLPMATCLVNAGAEVVGYDPRGERVEMLRAAGGRSARCPAEAAEGAHASILIPFDGAQLEDALLGADGVLSTLPAGAPVVAMPTVGPPAMQAIARRVAEAGDYPFVDAPVTGGAARAAKGDLTAIAAGSEQAMAAAMPLLRPMCSKVFTVGSAPGAGQTAKLINQLLVGIHLTATAEAFAMAQAAGVDTRLLYEILSSGVARSEILVSRVPTVLDGSLETGGAMAIFLKDLPLVLELGRALEVPLFTASAAYNVVQLAAQLGTEGDDAAVIDALMRLAAARAKLGTRTT
jgi:3-hydroxyisobutyrate dehydrogenase-like beta-hydroxyacid dehydrogenase